MVFQFGFVGTLAMSQPGKLLGIAEDELNLETQSVSLQNPGPVFFDVGTENEFVALNGTIGPEVLHRDKHDNSFETLDPDRARVLTFLSAS